MSFPPPAGENKPLLRNAREAMVTRASLLFMPDSLPPISAQDDDAKKH
jgi:hypothetical protein